MTAFAPPFTGTHSPNASLRYGSVRAWVTVIKSSTDPDAFVTVSVAVRCDAVVFGAALILIEPFPVRLLGVTSENVSQSWLLLILPHESLDDTAIVVLPPLCPGFHEPGDNISTGGAPACVTLTTLCCPSFLTVTVPVRSAPVFAAAFILNEPLPLRLFGVMFVIVSQSTLLSGVCHKPFDVTVIVVLDAVVPVLHVPGDSVSDVEGVTAGGVAATPSPIAFTARTRSVTGVPFGRFVKV